MPENRKHYRPALPTFSDEVQAGRDEITIRGMTYTRKHLIEEICAFAEMEPERTITRNYFRENSDIPEAAWTGMFGSFQEYVKAAGLGHSRYQNKVRLKVAQHASVDKIRKVSDERRSYGKLYERDHGNRFKTMIACSDLHDIECDQFYFRVLRDTIEMVQPDVVCLDGDIFDLPEFGKYDVDPREWDVVGRIEFGLDMIRQIREVAPEAQIDFIEGNHEARLIKHVVECSGAIRSLLGDLHGLDIPKLLKLDEYEVNYVADCDLATFTDAQTRKEIKKNHKVYWNSLMACHFPQARMRGMPGFNGHHHQHIVWSEHTQTYGSYEWHQMGAGHMKHASYCDGTKWNNGFLIANVDTETRSTNFDYVDVGDTFAVAAGAWYYRQKDEFYPELQHQLTFRK